MMINKLNRANNNVCLPLNKEGQETAQGALDQFVMESEVVTQILGLPMSSYQNAKASYREELQREGIAALLERAEKVGAIPDRDPVWLTFSPFGLHSKEFISLLKYTETRDYFNSCPSLHIACYGAGLHDELEYLRYRSDQPIGDLFKEFLKKIFGLTGRCSYEPRELILLFLRGDREGTIDIFENQPDLAQELERPTIPFISLTYENKEHVEFLVEYYKYLSRGREVNEECDYISLTSREMDKMRLRPVDIAVDQLEKSPCFHLSVWLESQYFFDEPMQWIILSKIVRAMEPGSYLLTNPIRQHYEKIVSYEDLRSFALMFGLEFIGLSPNHMGKKGCAALYRRTSDLETNIVKQLAQL